MGIIDDVKSNFWKLFVLTIYFIIYLLDLTAFLLQSAITIGPFEFSYVQELLKNQLGETERLLFPLFIYGFLFLVPIISNYLLEKIE
ncbi:MAG: hypothetical protein HeimC3_53540 [Candidatus Heimdallarchaeota archaeon LC_3]|nr:MAG: hypothetical protein HeimC3_53540 [Candidatus Heimdallarchaeota archaeon LC_3]